jgi:hypothetical protein
MVEDGHGFDGRSFAGTEGGDKLYRELGFDYRVPTTSWSSWKLDSS